MCRCVCVPCLQAQVEATEKLLSSEQAANSTLKKQSTDLTSQLSGRTVCYALSSNPCSYHALDDNGEAGGNMQHLQGTLVSEFGVFFDGCHAVLLVVHAHNSA